jgi:hypothetical protein
MAGEHGKMQHEQWFIELTKSMMKEHHPYNSDELLKSKDLNTKIGVFKLGFQFAMEKKQDLVGQGIHRLVPFEDFIGVVKEVSKQTPLLLKADSVRFANDCPNQATLFWDDQHELAYSKCIFRILSTGTERLVDMTFYTIRGERVIFCSLLEPIPDTVEAASIPETVEAASIP